MYLRYVHIAKTANCDQRFPSSDWSRLNFLLSHEINVVYTRWVKSIWSQFVATLSGKRNSYLIYEDSHNQSSHSRFQLNESKTTLLTPFLCRHDIFWNIKFPEFLPWCYLKSKQQQYKNFWSQISSLEFTIVFITVISKNDDFQNCL